MRECTSACLHCLHFSLDTPSRMRISQGKCCTDVFHSKGWYAHHSHIYRQFRYMSKFFLRVRVHLFDVFIRIFYNFSLLLSYWNNVLGHFLSPLSGWGRYLSRNLRWTVLPCEDSGLGAFWCFEIQVNYGDRIMQIVDFFYQFWYLNFI